MNKPYFIAETAFHHQGEMKFLLRLIDNAQKCDVDAVKFQVLTDINDLVSAKHSAYEALANYTFNTNQWRDIFQYTKSKGLDVIVLPLNVEAVNLAVECAATLVEIHSVSFNDFILRDAIYQSGIDVMLGVGGRTLAEVNKICVQFEEQLKVLMVGFQAFPSELTDVKLHRIASLKNHYPHLDIGYADHSDPRHEDAIYSSVYANYLGATYFEKHLTLEAGNDRVDAASAVVAEQLIEIIKRVRFSNQSQQFDPFEFSAKEVVYRNRQLIGVATKALKAGELISKSDVCLKMLDQINEKEVITHLDQIIGKRLNTDIEKDAAFNIKLIS